MKKTLYNTATLQLQPWSAGDADHVVGLESPLVELEIIQDAEPSYNPITHHLKASQIINLEARTVHNGFTVEGNIPLPAREAERYKVMEFLMRNAISLESIPSLIASVAEEGVERDVALMRWHEVPTFPKYHPLVVAVAAALNLDLDAVWDTILAIE